MPDFADPIPVSDNHRRLIFTTLAMLDEMLCAFEPLLEGKRTSAVLYQQQNNLSAEQRQRIREQIDAIRALLVELRDDLGLSIRTQTASSDIWSHLSSFRENVIELGGRHLKAYGQPSAELVTYIEPRAAKLLERIDHIAAIAQHVSDNDSSH